MSDCTLLAPSCWLALALACLLPACGGGSGTDDAGRGDSGTSDLGDTDQGSTDQGQLTDLGEDAGGGLNDCLAGFTPLPNAQYTSTNRFRTASGDIQLAFVIQPDPDSVGTSGTTPFVARALAIEVEGTVHCFDDPEDLDYQVSHHNFDDTLAVTVQDDVYTWKVDLEDYGDVPTYTITVEPPSALPSTAILTAVGCSTAPGDHRCFGPDAW